MPKVSIIIPIYNSEKYLARCLNSLISQTLEDIEVICVDSSTEDLSFRIIEEYVKTDNRIKYLKVDNHGPGGARNVGIDIAQGEFLSFIDSDDWIDKNYYEKLYESAMRNNADIASCGIVREHKFSKEHILKFNKEQVYEFVYEKLKVMRVPEISYSVNKIYNKAFMEKNDIRYPEDMFFEDVPFTFKSMYYSKKLVTVPKIYYHYFVNPNSILSTMSQTKEEDKSKAYKSVRDFAKSYGINLPEKDLVVKISYVKIFGISIIKTLYFETYKKDYLIGNILLGKTKL